MRTTSHCLWLPREGRRAASVRTRSNATVMAVARTHGAYAGHQVGEEFVVDALIAALDGIDAPAAGAISGAFIEAETRLRELQARTPEILLGVSAAAAVVTPEGIAAGWKGEVHPVLFRHGRAPLRTLPHHLHHRHPGIPADAPQAHILLRSLGHGDTPPQQVRWPAMQPGDVLVMGSWQLMEGLETRAFVPEPAELHTYMDRRREELGYGRAQTGFTEHLELAMLWRD